MKEGNPFFFFFGGGGGLNACKLFEFDAKVEISKKRTFNYGSVLFPARVYAIFRGVQSPSPAPLTGQGAHNQGAKITNI